MNLLFDLILQNDETDGCNNAVSKSIVSPDEHLLKQMSVRIVRSVGIGLGISIAGGLGSCPFVDEDEVRTRLFICSCVICAFICTCVHYAFFCALIQL